MLLKIMNLKSLINTIPLLAVMLSSGIMQGQPLVDGIVAVVGKNIVMKSDIDQQLQSLRNQGNTSGEGEMCRVFEDILFEKLLLHQSEIDSVSVTPEEVDAAVSRRLNLFTNQIGSRQKLEQYYKKSTLEIKEEMKPLIKDQMRAQRMMQEITGDIKITPAEVRRFYEEIPKDSVPLIDEEVEYAEIVKYPDVSPEAEQEAIKQLNEIRQRILDGSSFSALAVLYSEDPGSARDGGKYEGIKRGQFVPEFEAVAFNLKEGEISEPFKSEFGYHIVQLLQKRGQELDLRHILVKPKITKENLDKAKTFLDSVRTLILNGEITYEDAARKFSDDEDSRYNGGIQINPQTSDSRWVAGNLKKEVFYSLESLEEGDISTPKLFREQDGKEGFRLLKLIRKIEPHRATLNRDYQRLQEMALNKKRQKQIEGWVKEKIKDTYVRVNNEYFNCDFKNEWIKKSQYVE